MKIDLVYLWVDGSDPVWLARKNKAQGIEKPIADADSTADLRWADNDELVYSLRSAEKFAPWINHIYIITDGQTPKWLDTKNTKITIVDHTEIIPAECLPVFNSVAIELFLHKIPGLSEHFLYANDDMFFARSLTPKYFFDRNENPIVMMKLKRRPPEFFASAFEYKKLWNSESKDFRATLLNAFRFVYDKTGNKYDSLNFCHAIEPMRKSYLADNIKRYKQEFMAANCTTFRSRANIMRIVFPMLDNVLGRNKIVFNFSCFGVRPTYKPNCKKFVRFMRLAYKEITYFLKIQRQEVIDRANDIVKRIKRHRPSMFCINDEVDRKMQFIKSQKMMKEMFPEKSGFEL